MKNLSYIDGIFKSKWYSKFINQCCIKGNKFYMEKIIYFTFYLIKKNLKYSGLLIFFEILEKLKPSLGLRIFKLNKNKHKKFIVYSCLLKASLQYKKGIFWLKKGILLRKEQFLNLKIYNEFFDVLFTNEALSLKKKKEYYKFIVMFKGIKKFKWS